LECLGDAAAADRQSASGYYREAQRLLLPAGTVWTDRESYDRRMEAFERIQQKLYGLHGGSAPDVPAPGPEPRPKPRGAPPSTRTNLSVWDFFPGLTVRVIRTFRDYDGQEIRAGEVLHFAGSSYFFYDGGHTLRFAEKTIRLAGIVEEHGPIIANTGNGWFQPIDGEEESDGA
jgi:hypothetical protein